MPKKTNRVRRVGPSRADSISFNKPFSLFGNRFSRVAQLFFYEIIEMGIDRFGGFFTHKPQYLFAAEPFAPFGMIQAFKELRNTIRRFYSSFGQFFLVGFFLSDFLNDVHFILSLCYSCNV